MDKIHEMHREIRFKELKWGSSKYYDYPDGQDLLGKLSYTTKMVLIPSAMVGHFHGHNFKPYAVTNKEKLFRVLKFMVPGIGMAVTFTCVTYFATNIRKKDDPFNHFLGGVAAGSILGFVSGHTWGGIFGAMLCSYFATVTKMAQLEGRSAFPAIKTRNQCSYYARNLDYSLVSNDRKGNWTRDPPPEK